MARATAWGKDKGRGWIRNRPTERVRRNERKKVGTICGDDGVNLYLRAIDHRIVIVGLEETIAREGHPLLPIWLSR
jgi:hypothetical protein